METIIKTNQTAARKRKFPSPPLLALTLAGVIAALGVVNKANADNLSNLGNPQIVPPQAEFQGLTYGEWAAEWLIWANSLPLMKHPLTDTADCSAGQKGNVWFIDGTIGTPFPSEGRDCTIKPGTALFLNLNASSWDNEACSSDTVPVVQRTNFSEAELRAKANNDLINGYGFRKIIIDGVEVKGLPAACDPANPASCQSPYRAQTPVFDYTIPALDNTLIFFDGPCYNDPNNNGQPYKVTGAVADGYFAMIKPLKVGKHVLQFGRLDATTGKPNRLYNVTVSPHKHVPGKKGFN
jgi:hypothetical protein